MTITTIVIGSMIEREGETRLLNDKGEDEPWPLPPSAERSMSDAITQGTLDQMETPKI